MKIRLIQSLLAASLLLGCGDDDTTTPDADNVAPRAINDLTSIAVDENAVTLRWTAPGDDGPAGQASSYDLRYSTTGLTDVTWGAATRVTSLPNPQFSGGTEVFEVVGLVSGEHSFAINASDEAANWSELSNVVTVAVGDSIPPAAITNLLAFAVGVGSITLEWTAPGDDGSEGTAREYDLRHALVPITDVTWDEATRVEGVTTPSAPGTTQSHTVTDLTVDQTYYFALRTSDGVNWSELSNVASAATTPDTSVPAAVLDLASSSANTGTTVTLTWTATGDDGTDGRAERYALRYSRDPITEENWDSAMSAVGLPAPDRAGTSDTTTVRGLEPVTMYFFALRVADESRNWSALSNVVAVTTENFWQLTESPGDGGAFDPSWSPDGKRIAFRGYWEENSDIYTISASGGPAVRMTNQAAYDIDPAWSPDGSRIAFASGPVDGPNYDLFVMDASPGATPTLIASHDQDSANPTWSPDGTRIAFGPTFIQLGSRYDVFVVPSTGGTPELLIPGDSEWANFNPAWSPDGARVAIVSSRAFSWDLWIISLVGGEPFQVTRSFGLEDQNLDPAWSPDGTELLFRGVRKGNLDIYRIAATGGTATRLTMDPSRDFDPAWSPKGDRFAFNSDRSGRFEIWIQLLE